MVRALGAFFSLTFLYFLCQDKKYEWEKRQSSCQLQITLLDIKSCTHLLLFFFVLMQERTKKNQARTLPLYPLLTALPPSCPSGPRCSCTSTLQFHQEIQSNWFRPLLLQVITTLTFESSAPSFSHRQLFLLSTTYSRQGGWFGSLPQLLIFHLHLERK